MDQEEHFRNQAHARWLKESKEAACNILKNSYGDSFLQAYIIGPKRVSTADYETELEKQLEAEEYTGKAILKLPIGSIQVFLAMARFTQVAIEIPIILNKNYLEKLPVYSFSLSSLLLASYPRSVSDSKFKKTTGGMLIGLTNEAQKLPGAVCLHAIFSGLGVLLMDLCREEISPFSTDEDMIKLTFEMFLVFTDEIIQTERKP